MTQRNQTAASQVYPHLPHAGPEPPQRQQPRLADAMFPSLSREAKQRQADQALWARINERNRQTLLRNLREARANIDKRRR
jgi:hypothetical protein